MNAPLKALLFPALLLSACLAHATGGEFHLPPVEQPVNAIVGANHVGGKYYFTQRPYLKEGADRILEMGSRTVKLWLNKSPGVNYYYNTNWGQYLLSVKSVTDLIQVPYYREALELPFSTVVLMTTEFSMPNWKNGVSETQKQLVRAELQQLTEYLLTEYSGTGKTFIITNWESDNHINLSSVDPSLWPQYIQGMIDWTNARQDGIIAGRSNVGMDGVAVFGAFEVNHIPVNRTFDWPVTIDVVVPHTYCDIYAYSNWGTKIPGEEWQILDNLDYIASKAPPSPYFGRRNVFLGEWGAYEVSYMSHQFPEQPGDTRVHDAYSDNRQREVVMRNLDLALRWGIPYALYWQIYCNGVRSGVSIPLGQTAVEQQLRGVWLVRAPSPLLGLPYSFTSTWGSLSRRMTTSRLFDDLLSFDGLHAHSPNLVHKTDDPEWALRDNSRMAASAPGTEAWMTYRTNSPVEDYHIKVFHPHPAGDAVGWWPLDEWDGTQAADHSGNALRGTRLLANAGFAPAAPVAFSNPYAADFDGAQFVAVPPSPQLDNPAWTLSGWFRAPADLQGAAYRTIAAREAGATERQFAILVNSTTGRLLVKAGSGAAQVTVPTPTADLRDQQWHRFALVSDGATLVFHLDGHEGVPVAGVTAHVPGRDLLIGASFDGSNTYYRWLGQLDDIRFHHGALSFSDWQQASLDPPVVLNGQLQVELSADGMQWVPAPFHAEHTRTTAGSGVARSYLRPAQPIPAGMQYLRLRWTDAPARAIEIGDISLITGDRQWSEASAPDLALVHADSGNWEVAATGPAGATPGFRPTDDAPAWLVHRANAIDQVEHTLLHEGPDPATVNYAYSFDGWLWSPLASELAGSSALGGNWTEQTWRPLAIPDGARYIRLEIGGPAPEEAAVTRFAVLHSPRLVSPDSDGDGWLDLEESWLGTDPHDPFSRFEIETIAVDSQGVHLGFQSVPGTRYRIQRLRDSSSQRWEDWITLEASGSHTEALDADALDHQLNLYRVRLAPW